MERSSGIGPGFEVVDSGPNEPKLFLRSLFPKLCAITGEEHGVEEEERQRVVEGLGAGVELREEQSSHRGCVVSRSLMGGEKSKEVSCHCIISNTQ